MRLSTLGLAVVLAVSTTAFAAEPLQLLFQDRPPYYTSNTDGTKGGLVSGPVEKALTRAGIPFTWVHSSGKGQIETVRRGGEVVCTPGWFKKPEREEFAKFSDPVYRDRPQVVIARTDSRDVFGHRTLAAPEEFESLADRLGIAGEDIAAIEMTDIPPGNKRYLMCSKDVADGIIDRFNEALAAGRQATLGQ